MTRSSLAKRIAKLEQRDPYAEAALLIASRRVWGGDENLPTTPALRARVLEQEALLRCCAR